LPLGVRRPAGLDADEDARPPLPHVIETFGQKRPLVVRQAVRSHDPLATKDMPVAQLFEPLQIEAGSHYLIP